MKKAIFNWSGGKDSALALYKVLEQGDFKIEHLFTTISEKYERISMHGVRLELLKLQALSIGIPLDTLKIPSPASMKVYDNLMRIQNKWYKDQKFDYSIFGDIFLEDLRKYREDQLAKLDLKPVFPIWGQNTRDTVMEFINLGFKAITVSVDATKLDESFVGRIIDMDFLNDLPKNVDPCGENGEFHSFVYDGPIFQFPVEFEIGEKVLRKAGDENKAWSSAFWYCDLILK